MKIILTVVSLVSILAIPVAQHPQSIMTEHGKTLVVAGDYDENTFYDDDDATTHYRPGNNKGT